MKSLQQKNRLLFDRAAASWNEAAPLGNGILGAMVFGRMEKELICMNEDSLWSGGPLERENPDTRGQIPYIRELLREGEVKEAHEKISESFYSKMPHGRHYEPLGQVWIEYGQTGIPGAKVKSYQRTLDITEAVGTVSCQWEDSSQEKRETFVSAPDNVFVYRIRRGGGKELNLEIYLTRRDIGPGRSVSYADDVSVKNKMIFLTGYNGNREGGLDYAMGLAVSSDGTVTSCGSRLVVRAASEAVIYVTGRTSFRSEAPEAWCADTLAHAAGMDYGELKRRHIADYKRYYERMNFRLGADPAETEEEGAGEREKDSAGEKELTVPGLLEQVRSGCADTKIYEMYFNFGRYLFISCSRPGSLPANLQGIWSYEFNPCWGSRYTININIQMNYWLAEKTGLPELHLPLMEHQKRMLPNGRKAARELYGARGMCAHHNTDIWGDCAPADYNFSSTVWVMGAAWLALHIWEHYQYTKDRDFLKEYFEILEENALFFIDYLFLDADGYYKTGPSVSPENIYLENGQPGCVCNAPSMDIQILRELFHAYLGACAELGEGRYTREVRERLEKLPPIRVGKHGQIMEWQKDYDELEKGHRHISQLFALYPGIQIRRDKTPDLAEAAERTIARRLENGGGHTGWSCAWIIHFFARLGKAEEAYGMCRKLLADSTLDNLFDNHPPFQIDGNFGGASGMLEMIVQDFGEDVFLLPALPDQWSEGSITGIRLKCGAVLSMSWKEKKAEKIQLEAQRDLEAVLHNGSEERHVILKKGEEQTYGI